MLVIRMQRSGRKGHAMFRVVVQDSRRTPTSGKLVAQLGSYDPHAKSIIIDKVKAQFYIDNGAQPSERAAGLLEKEGLKLPDWVNKASTTKQRTVRNIEKRRSTRPAEEKVAEEVPAAPAEEPEATPEPAEPEAETPEPEAKTEDTPTEVVAEAEAPAEEIVAETPEEPAKSE